MHQNVGQHGKMLEQFAHALNDQAKSKTKTETYHIIFVIQLPRILKYELNRLQSLPSSEQRSTNANASIYDQKGGNPRH